MLVKWSWNLTFSLDNIPLFMDRVKREQLVVSLAICPDAAVDEGSLRKDANARMRQGAWCKSSINSLPLSCAVESAVRQICRVYR